MNPTAKDPKIAKQKWNKSRAITNSNPSKLKQYIASTLEGKSQLKSKWELESTKQPQNQHEITLEPIITIWHR